MQPLSAASQAMQDLAGCVAATLGAVPARYAPRLCFSASVRLATQVRLASVRRSLFSSETERSNFLSRRGPDWQPCMASRCSLAQPRL